MRCQKGVLRQIHRGSSVLLSLLLYRLQRTELVARKTFRLSKIGPEFSDSKRRASGGVFGFSAVSSNRLLWLQAPIDWGQSIYHFDAQAEGGFGFTAVRLDQFQCEAIPLPRNPRRWSSY